MASSLRKRWIGLTLMSALFSLLILLSVNAAGPGPGGTISGSVTAIKGAMPFSLPGLADVQVSVEPGGYTAKTDRRGGFSLSVPPGTYEVTFSAPGFEAYTEKVAVPVAAPASVSVALFPEPQGLPVAVLKRGGRAPSQAPVPYNTTVSLDASDSQNISRYGIRWEVKDAAGRIVNDPYAVPARPMQLEPSPIPGSSPLDYSFTPPRPGKFVVRLLLNNRHSGDQESAGEQVVVAVNTAPEALPGVVGGLTTTIAGRPVYLAGWGLDKNMSSPELYNPGGRVADNYGKNDDRLQRSFAWTWRLQQVDAGGGRADVTGLLKSDGSSTPVATQYPWFVASTPGEYVATLVVADQDPSGGLSSAPVDVAIKVLPADGATVAEQTCLADGCHTTLGGAQVSAGEKPAGGMPCQSCHGPGAPHVAAQDQATKKQTMVVSYEAGQCGECHSEYGEWQKSRHADGYPFGYYEIAQPLLLNCAKCHYPRGFADAVATSREKKISFGQVEFKKPLRPGGPPFFDFDKLPVKNGEGVACQACHDPHRISKENPQGFRAPKAELCGTCHEEKWQNVLLQQTAGRVGSAYEYPGAGYPGGNPHNTPEKCVLCHMDSGATAKDAGGVRRLGGHTMRLRDAGPDGRLGGFGPSPDDPARLREDSSADDLVAIQVCRKCHADATSFDYRGRQAEIYKLWAELGRLLKKHNSGLLPGYKPGDKCATCHRGGTLPFDNDPHLVLENAYTNYKLVMNDRSWGVHNYQYTRRLLEDSLASVRALP